MTTTSTQIMRRTGKWTGLLLHADDTFEKIHMPRWIYIKDVADCLPNAEIFIQVPRWQNIFATNKQTYAKWPAILWMDVPNHEYYQVEHFPRTAEEAHEMIMRFK